LIVTQIEKAIIARLQTGMGKLVREVKSYSGELDGQPENVIRQLPAVWVTFGGIQGSELLSTARNKWRDRGRFVVIAGTRNTRSDEATRQGGAAKNEVGSYQLVYAIRRLLGRQDLGLPIDFLMPGAVRTLFNTELQNHAMSVFACEFDTRFDEAALDNGKFPLAAADLPAGHSDRIFSEYSGQTSPDDPVWLSTNLNYLLGGKAPPAAQDIISHES
jgi:phage gp37-like protein